MSRVFLLSAILLMSACDGSVRREGPPQVELAIVRVDSAHNRRWVLETSALAVYDNLNHRRLRLIALPDWVLAGPYDSSPPDIVLDRGGAAYVSSNVLPVLWRVDPRSFQVTKIELVLDAHADKDIGFTALQFVGDGVLAARGSTLASQWLIDLRRGTAMLAENPL